MVETYEFNGRINTWLLCTVRAADHVMKERKLDGSSLVYLAKVLRAKFNESNEMLQMLLSTGDAEIVFKKKSHPLGRKNTLGILLTRIRDKFARLYKIPDGMELCPRRAINHGDRGCYGGKYWVPDFKNEGRMKHMGKCYSCKGKGYVTLEGHTEEDGTRVWSDKERNDRYHGKKEMLTPESVDPLDGPVSVC